MTEKDQSQENQKKRLNDKLDSFETFLERKEKQKRSESKDPNV